MKNIVFTVFILFVVFFNTNAQSYSKKFSSSKLAYSDNGNFVFVLVSNDSLEDYAVITRKSWEPLNLSLQELKEYEKNLAGVLAEEIRIRNLYSSSGLFLKSNPKKVLWKIPSQEIKRWLDELDNVFIADDGSYVIGYNPEVTETESGLPNKIETGVFIYSSDFGYLLYKVSELTNQSDTFVKSSEGYYWAKKEPILDKQNKTFTLIKQDESKLKFSLIKGEILSDPSKEHSSCLSLILLILIVVRLL